ncbi:YbaK/EbsC family protein [uncultured Peptoniphilus sp.]|uniref:YbaK/EbsC family protein n=2 Tax=Peptoniphilus TaxID=162289 RepID=UPI00258C2A56|nr:YbaK/EbsC family protein [uncultured Peptoniphilus sp.]
MIKIYGVREMSIEKVKNYFKDFGIEDRIREFETSSATVELAAAALNCQPERIAKSLSFIVKDKPVIIVTAGDVKIDNKKFKEFFATKAKMIDKDRVEELIGHEVGGVCPFAINEGVEVYLDKSLKRFVTVFPACGSSNSAIELSIEELEKCSNYKAWLDVCKN